MSVRIGDNVFIQSGVPATVKDRDQATGKLSLEADLDKVQEDTRHGYINGLSQESRGKLYAVLDEVKAASEDPSERVEQMRAKLDELDKDPRNQQLGRYLKAEITHIMNTNALKPREYVVAEGKVR